MSKASMKLCVWLRCTLMHENEYVEEVRWEEDDEIVTHVSLKKTGCCGEALSTV